MAKKSFKDNPALRFISEAAEPTDTPEQEAPATVIPEGYKLNPLYVEKRTKRLQLVLQPSIYEKAKAKAKADGYKSLNDYIHKLLEEETK